MNKLISQVFAWSGVITSIIIPGKPGKIISLILYDIGIIIYETNN